MSASVSRTVYAQILAAHYASALADPASAALATSQGYAREYAGMAEHGLGLPWHDEHWTRFWTNYLHGVRNLKAGVGADRAWDFLVPFEVLPVLELTGAEGASARVRTFLYPASVVAVVEVELRSEIPFEQLAARVSASRGPEWQSGPASQRRNLAGLLDEAVSRGAARLLGGAPAYDESVSLSVAVPACGSLSAAQAALPSADAVDTLTAKTIAGLATLAPPGGYVAERLLDANSAGDAQTRTYLTQRGHVLWHPDALTQPCTDDGRDTAGCLMRNHVALVAHVEALGFVARWAASRMRDHTGLTDPQARLVRRATDRLLSLSEGNRGKTYRSQVASLRIKPLLPDIQLAQSGL